MKEEPRVWYNPKPADIGTILSEQTTPDGRAKAVVFRNQQGSFTVYFYRLDDSDLQEGRSNSVGWIHEFGPSLTDSLERAQAIASEYVTGGVRRRTCSKCGSVSETASLSVPCPQCGSPMIDTDKFWHEQWERQREATKYSGGGRFWWYIAGVVIFAALLIKSCVSS
jgi:predicted RNA-binding Zn-ribbon protein involved in translation (DUF1610 family)